MRPQNPQTLSVLFDCHSRAPRLAIYTQQMSAMATFDNWMDPPHNRWAFHHVADLMKTAPISNQGNSQCGGRH